MRIIRFISSLFWAHKLHAQFQTHFTNHSKEETEKLNKWFLKNYGYESKCKVTFEIGKKPPLISSPDEFGVIRTDKYGNGTGTCFFSITEYTRLFIIEKQISKYTI